MNANNPPATPTPTPLGALMVDIGGETITSEECDFLRHPAVGGVILFARNYRDKAQVSALVETIAALRTPPLLVAVDQEGGPVQRFVEGFHRLPAAARFGEVYDRDPARGLRAAANGGALMAAEVRQTGVDLSFAPVLDCANPESEVIGVRAFHHEPAVICALAGAWIDGMNRAGMAATGKHFPGHGHVRADSHFETPVDSRALADIVKHDLPPFAGLARRLGGVMTAHVLYERIDPHLPAYSRFWLQQVLRRDVGFAGVIFSDDLSMKGAAAATTAGSADLDLTARSIAALDAGCDTVLICNDPDNARRVADGLSEKSPPNQDRLLSLRAHASKAPDPTPQSLAQLAEKLAADLT